MSNLIDRYVDLFEPRAPRSVCSLGSSAGSSSSSSANIPAGLKPLISQSAGTYGALGTAATPGLFEQLQAHPEQIAPLTPAEQHIIGVLQTEGGRQSNPLITGAEGQISSADDQLAQLTGGPIGSSPATIAAMQAYNTNAVPQAEQALALSGSGRGGGATEALTSSREAAYTPLVQQEIANRENAVNQFSNLAGQQSGLAGQQANLASTALQAAELPQQTQQAGYTAAYQDMLRRFGLDQTATLGPIQQVLGQLIGQNQSGSSSSTPSTLSTTSSILNSLLGAGAVGSMYYNP